MAAMSKTSALKKTEGLSHRRVLLALKLVKSFKGSVQAKTKCSHCSEIVHQSFQMAELNKQQVHSSACLTI